MDVNKVIKKRYSVRSYKSDTIEDKKLLAILEAGRMAPTAGNKQPFQIMVIHTKDREEELLSIYPKIWFVQAPVILAVCGIADSAWVRKDGRKYLFADAGIVMGYMVLAAYNLGLGTCFVAAFDEMNARKVLQIPDEAEPILFTPLGYPADSPKVKDRKEMSEILRYEHW